ncbi:MAG: hypothetical protein AB1Z98_38445 [Nannocystaceae bacterium]
MKRGVFAWVLLAGCAGGLGSDGDGTAGLGGSTDGDSGDPDPGASTTEPGSTSTGGSTTTEGGGDDTTTGAIPCVEPWRTVRTDGTLSDVVVDPAAGIVHAIGFTDAGEGWGMALDACDGTVLADTTVVHGAGETTRLDSLVLGSGVLFAVGSVTLAADPRNGLYARIDPRDMSTVWTTSLYGSPGQDEVLDVALGNNGRVWMTGTSSYDVAPTAWTVSGNTVGEACGFGWGGADSGSGRAIAVDGDELVVAVRTTEGQIVLLRYDQACTCMCQPTWVSPPIAVGTMDTSIGDLMVLGGQYYVAGWANDGSTSDGLYLQLSWVSSTGTVIETYLSDPTPFGDGLFSLGADDERLYLSGGSDWMGEPGFVGAHAIIQALPRPLTADAQPLWEASPTDVDYVQGIGIEPGPDGYLYVGGNIDGVGTVLRCDKQGECG